jgi:hypothetical protein
MSKIILNEIELPKEGESDIIDFLRSKGEIGDTEIEYIFEDDKQKVHCGEIIVLLSDGQEVEGRFEMTNNKKPLFFVGEKSVLISPDMSFRRDYK